VVEEIVGSWLKEIPGLPAHASFATVTGCQTAHATCLAARHALLAALGWDVESQGLFGTPPIRILTSVAKHGSFERAVRLLGFGLSQIVGLPTDAQDRLEVGALEQALQGDSSAPTIVLLQAGDNSKPSEKQFGGLPGNASHMPSQRVYEVDRRDSHRAHAYLGRHLCDECVGHQRHRNNNGASGPAYDCRERDDCHQQWRD
jgi:hypothetical protein